MPRRLEIEIIGNERQYIGALNKSSRATSGFGRSLRNLGKVAAVGVGAAFAGLAATLKVGFDEMAESQKVVAQTGAVLKSTGGAAKVTASDVEGLASSLSRMSGVDDELIQSGENVLLTFTRIRNEVGKGNDIFDQATQATLNLSVALGKDMQGSAILVGKALNDPIKGMSALSRAGIQFTAEQKKTIEGLVETGKTMEAQKLILAELETQFGGSAKAFGETMPGQLAKLRNSFEETAGSVVQTLLPYLTRLTSWANDHMPQIQKVIQTSLDAVIGTINFLVPVVQKLIGWFQTLARVAQEQWPKVRAAAEAVANWYRSNLQPTMESVSRNIARAWERMGTDMQASLKGHMTKLPPVIAAQLANVGSVMNVGLAILRGDWSTAWAEIKEIPIRTFRALVQTVKMMASTLYNAALAVGRAIIDGIIAGIEGAAGRLWGKITSTIESAKDKLKIWGSGPDEWAHEAVGVKVIDGIISGLKAKDFTPAIRQKIDAAIDAARSAIMDRRGDLASAFSVLTSEALAAFDKLSSDFMTKTEQKIARQDERRAGGDRQRALQEAQAGLTEAEAGGDPEAILDAERQLEEARFAIQRAADEKRAAQERKTYEDRRARQRRHFEEDLTALGLKLAQGELTQEQANQRLIKLFKKYEIPFKNAAVKLGHALAEGLREAGDEVGRQAARVKDEIMKHLSNISVRVSVDVVVPDRPDRENPRGHQHGGSFRSGDLLRVGEGGPELVRFGAGGSVIPNHRLAGAAAGGATIVLNFHGPTVGTSRDFEDAVRRALFDVQRRNGTSGI